MDDHITNEHQKQDLPQFMPHAPSQAARRGWEFYASKDYSRAADSFHQALQENPADIDSLYALGMTLRYSGQSKPAVDVFREVMDRSGEIENGARSRMVHRLAHGHINQIEMGDWNLEKELWSKKQ